MSILRNKQGQSTAEYAVVIAIVLGAVVGMQTYIKRGFQAKLKSANDKLTGITAASGGAGVDPGLTAAFTGTKNQYEPYYAESHVQVDSTNPARQTDTFAGSATGFSVTKTGVIRDITRKDAAGGTAQVENDWSKKADDAAWK